MMVWLAGWVTTLAAVAGPGSGPGGHLERVDTTLCPAFVVASPAFAAETGLPGNDPADRWLAEDKAQHFAMSFAATSMSYGAARLALEPRPAGATAVGVAALLGIGKELWDLRRGGPFSLKDLAWDALGVALGYTLVQRID